MPDELKALLLLAGLGLAGLSLVAILAVLSAHWNERSEGIVQLFHTAIGLLMGLLYRIAVLVSSRKTGRQASRRHVTSRTASEQPDKPP